MKVLCLCLVALACASLVTAGFFTPKHNSKDDVIVNKEGVVIGIEKDDGKTKVSVSPQDSSHEADEKGLFANAKEKLEEASSSVLQKGADSANRDEEEESHHKFRPGEVVCDAFGKCKEKIESYMGRTVGNGATEKAEEAMREAKDRAARTAHVASGKAHKVKESLKDAASEVSSKAKDKVSEKASEMKEGAKEKAKEAGKMVKNEGKKGLKGVFGFMISPVRVAGVLHLLGFASAYGTCVWVTFASNYVLAKALPRQQLAVVQSKMYPLYFKAMASSVGMALVGRMIGQGRRFSPFGFDLLAPLVMTLVNLLYLEPRTTKVMFERMKKEKEEGGGKGDATVPSGGAAGGGTTAEGHEKREEAVAKSKNMGSGGTLLGRLNSYSSLLNVATLASLTWHLVQLGHHLYAVC